MLKMSRSDPASPSNSSVSENDAMGASPSSTANEMYSTTAELAAVGSTVKYSRTVLL